MNAYTSSESSTGVEHPLRLFLTTGTCLTEVAMPVFPSHSSLCSLRFSTFSSTFCLQLPDIPAAEVQLKQTWQKTEETEGQTLK